MATTSKSTRNSKAEPPEKPDEPVQSDDATEPVPDQEGTVSLVDDHDRKFAPSPAGAVFTYTFEDGTGLKVWQYPLPRGKNRPAPDESAATSVNQWRARRISDTGVAHAVGSNPDRVFTTTAVNDLVEQFAKKARLDS